MEAFGRSSTDRQLAHHAAGELDCMMMTAPDPAPEWAGRRGVSLEQGKKAGRTKREGPPRATQPAADPFATDELRHSFPNPVESVNQTALEATAG